MYTSRYYIGITVNAHAAEYKHLLPIPIFYRYIHIGRCRYYTIWYVSCILEHFDDTNGIQKKKNYLDR